MESFGDDRSAGPVCKRLFDFPGRGTGDFFSGTAICVKKRFCSAGQQWRDCRDIRRCQRAAALCDARNMRMDGKKERTGIRAYLSLPEMVIP